MTEPEKIQRGELFDALRAGATVLTPTRRLAGAIRQQYDLDALSQGLDVWRTPDVRPFSQWQFETWQEGQLDGAIDADTLLLTPEQEQHLWERIIREQMADEPLQQVTGTVREAREAWQLLHDWQIPLDDAAFRSGRDSATFQRWATQFEARCEAEGWLSPGCLTGELQVRFEEGALPPPRRLLLLSFDELTPAQRALTGSLGRAGTEVRNVSLPGPGGDCRRIECSETRQEADLVARWVRGCVDRDPGATVGVVVPDLASSRQVITQALDTYLVPGSLQPGYDAPERPYNVSLGQPLAHYPLIACALHLLGLLRPTLAVEDAARLLRSPFIAGWPEESGSRALLEQRLRAGGEALASLGHLRFLAGSEGEGWSSPRLAAGLGRWIARLDELPASAGTDVWAEQFVALLDTIGWSAGRPLASDEYQALEAWRDLLSVFSALEPVTTPVSAETARALLARLALERSFQPQTETLPVQVLGTLEAMGLAFDHLWVMGLDDATWPSPPRPNPFIPIRLQRDSNLPRSSEQRELEVARAITSRLIASATDTILSSSRRLGDEELRPSPLIESIPEVTPDDLDRFDGTRWRDLIAQSSTLEEVARDVAPPFAGTQVRGGAAVFRHQAACPFRAFAEIRLGAQQVEAVDTGISPMLRGTLVHASLERVWSTFDSGQALRECPEEELAARIGTAVDAALEEYSRRYPHTLVGRVLELERGRLGEQLTEWLEVERLRPPFVVTGREEPATASAGGIEASLRIDRIDRLEDGRTILIDYKTGTVSPGEWFGDRPGDPQLPLYSLAVDRPLAALLFAQVRARECAFRGAAEEDGLVPGVRAWSSLRAARAYPTWQDLLDDWRATLERIGAEFKAGNAAVDPTADACTWCHLAPLCRIDERTDLRAERGPDGDGGEP